MILYLTIVNVMFVKYAVKDVNGRTRVYGVRVNGTLSLFTILNGKRGIPLTRGRRRFVRLRQGMVVTYQRRTNFSTITFATLCPRLRRLLQRVGVPAANVLLVCQNSRRTFASRRLVLRPTNGIILQRNRHRQRAMRTIIRNDFRMLTMGMKRRRMTRLWGADGNDLILGTMKLLPTNTINEIIPRRQERSTRTMPTRRRVLHNVTTGTTGIKTFMRRTTRVRKKRRIRHGRGITPPEVIITDPSTTVPIRPSTNEAKMCRGTLIQLRPLRDLAYHANRIVAGGVVCLIIPRAPLFNIIMGRLVVIFIIKGPYRRTNGDAGTKGVRILLTMFLGLDGNLFRSFLYMRSDELIRVVPRTLSPLVRRGFVLATGPDANFQIRRVERICPSQPRANCGKNTVLVHTRMTIFRTLLMRVVSVFSLSYYVSSKSGVSTLHFRLNNGIYGAQRTLHVRHGILMALRMVSVRGRDIRQRVVNAMVYRRLTSLILIRMTPTTLNITGDPFKQGVATPRRLTRLIRGVNRTFTLGSMRVMVFLNRHSPRNVRINMTTIGNSLTQMISGGTGYVLTKRSRGVVDAMRQKFTLNVITIVKTFTFMRPPTLISAASVLTGAVRSVLQFRNVKRAVQLLNRVKCHFRRKRGEARCAFNVGQLPMLLFMGRDGAPLLYFLGHVLVLSEWGFSLGPGSTGSSHPVRHRAGRRRCSESSPT